MPTSNVQSVYGGAAPVGGGGGLTGFTGSVSTTAPNDTIHAAVLAATSASNDVDFVIGTKSQGAIVAGLAPNGLASGGDKRGTYAVDLQTLRSGNGQVATGSRSVICGGQSNQNNGQHSVIVGGFTNTIINASQGFIGGGQTNQIVQGTNGTIGGGDSNLIMVTGSHQTIAGGRGNQARDGYVAIGGGYSNTCYASYGTIAGGFANQASQMHSTVVSGNGCTAGSTYSTVLNGTGNNINGAYSTAINGSYHINQGAPYSTIVNGFDNLVTPDGDHSIVCGVTGYADRRGLFVHSGRQMNIRGDNQFERMVLNKRTDNNITTEATYDSANTGVSIITRYGLRNRSAAFITVKVIARQQSNIPGEQGAWELKCLLINGTGTASIVGTVAKTVIAKTANATSWDVNLDVDGNNCLKVMVTGPTGNVVYWTAVVDSVVVNSQT